MDTNEISGVIVDAAIKVHSKLGPGLLEKTYELCLAHELRKRGHHVQSQLELPVEYDDIIIDAGYRIDLLVDDTIVIELKAVEKIIPIHKAQILNYLKATDYKVGLLVNFAHPKAVIKRFVL